MKNFLKRVKNSTLYFFYQLNKECHILFNSFSPLFRYLIIQLYVFGGLFLFEVSLLAIIWFLAQLSLAAILTNIIMFTIFYCSAVTIYLTALVIGAWIMAATKAAIETIRAGNAIFYYSFLRLATERLVTERLVPIMTFISLSNEDEDLLLTTVGEYFNLIITPARKNQLLDYSRRTGSEGFTQRLTEALDNFINNRPYIFNREEQQLLTMIKTLSQELIDAKDLSRGITEASRQFQSLKEVESLTPNKPRKEINTHTNKLLTFTRSIDQYRSIDPQRDAPIKKQAKDLEQNVERLLNSLRTHNF
jgi:hypothetical protein